MQLQDKLKKMRTSVNCGKDTKKCNKEIDELRVNIAAKEKDLDKEEDSDEFFEFKNFFFLKII